jgi:hypothetical protein
MLSMSSCVFLALYTVSIEKFLFSSFAHFFIESLILWEFSLFFSQWFCFIVVEGGRTLWHLKSSYNISNMSYLNSPLLPFSFLKKFISIYSLNRGRFIVTILIRLVLYISYLAPIIYSLNLPPCPISSNSKRFLCSISYKYMKSINPHLNLLHSLPSYY